MTSRRRRLTQWIALFSTAGSVALAAALPPMLRQRKHDGRLVSVCMQGDAAEATRLLATGASPNAAGEGEWTALTIAARDGHLDVVRRLVEHGARINGTDVWGFTALFWAAAHGHLAIVRYLLDHRADPSTHNRDYSALTEAASRGHAAVVTLLLQHGAEVNWRGSSGLGALSYAQRGHHAEVVRILMEAGACPEKPEFLAKAPGIFVTHY